jgi:hypothetical protein
MPSKKADLVKAFKTFDKDNSGSLDAQEFLAILTRESGGLQMNEEDAKEMLEEFDENGDGVLQMDEFISAMTELEDFADDGDIEDEVEDDDDLGGDEPDDAAGEELKPKAAPKVSADGIEWTDPRGPCTVRVHLDPKDSSALQYTVLPGGEGPPAGTRKNNFKTIKFQVDSDGKAFLELMDGMQDNDDPGNLCFPSTDPDRFQAAQQLRDFCKSKGINGCDVGLYLNTDGFCGLPSCWSMENFDNPTMDKPGPATICFSCSGAANCCWQCGVGNSTYKVMGCRACRKAQNSGITCCKCKKPHTAAVGHKAAKSCSKHYNPSECAYCCGGI